MTAVLDAAALVVAAGAVVVGMLTATVGGLRTGVPVLLDLLLAAGLLRLAADPGWDRILVTAAIVAVRHLLGPALRQAHAAAMPERPTARRGG